LYLRIIELQGDPFTTPFDESTSESAKWGAHPTQTLAPLRCAARGPPNPYLILAALRTDWRESFEQQRNKPKSTKNEAVKPSIAHFAKGLEELEIPAQAATLFRSPFFHHYVALYPHRKL
jgi:hypothetical protein